MHDRNLEALWDEAPKTTATFDPAMVDPLPEPARRYLLHTFAPGAPLASAARLDMHGEIRLQGVWYPFEAEQVLSWERGFVWHARAKVKGLPVSGFDRLIDGEGAMRCMKMALADVKVPVDYINPHATSTPIGDIKEIEAIREVFGDRIPPISATKSLTGHSLGAAGVQEAIYSLLMMNNGFICESANIEELDPAFEDMPIVRARIDNASLNCVMSNSFGFGGTNASLIFNRYNG